MPIWFRVMLIISDVEFIKHIASIEVILEVPKLRAAGNEREGGVDVDDVSCCTYVFGQDSCLNRNVQRYIHN